MMFILRRAFFTTICLFYVLCTNAQPTWQSSATAIGSSNIATVNKPAGTASGELLVVGLMFEKGSAVVVTPPSGWVSIRSTDQTTNVGMKSFYKVTSGSEPGSYTFILTNTPKWAIGISRITGANNSAPINVSGGNSGSSGQPTAPTVTTTVNNTLVLAFYTNKKNATYIPAAGTIERYDVPNNPGGLPSNMMATFDMATAGATGGKTATASVTEAWVAQQVAIAPAPPLPIELIDFKGSICGQTSVCLSWSTASETNNDYFTIERSESGISWQKLIDVPGAVNSFTTRSYAAVDESPNLGLNYYRLKQTDFDGHFEFFAIVAVNFWSIDSKERIIFPNPAKDQIMLIGFETESVIRIFDSLGKEVIAPITMLQYQIVIDISHLVSGIYYIKTSNSTHIIFI